MTQPIGHGFESLEERTLLTGNVVAGTVTATLAGGTLTITGDATANNIDVTGTGSQGGIEVEVNGQTLKITGGTAVSGHADEGKFTGVTNIVINGSGGNDYVDVYDLNIKGSLTAVQGAGSDDTDMYGLTLGGSLTALGGSGNGDETHMYGLYVGGSLTYTGGSGNGSYLDAGNLHVTGSLLATQGAGTEDDTYLYNLAVNGNVTAVDGSGTNDRVEVAAYGGFNSYIGGSVNLNAGTGANSEAGVYLDSYSSRPANLSIGGSLTVTGTYDYVDASGYGGHLSVTGGVTLNVNSAAGGNGYGVIDSYGTAGINIGGSVVINGGAGSDKLGLASHGGEYGFGINQTVPGISVHGNVTINGNGGNDQIGIQAIGQHAYYGVVTTQHGHGFNSGSVNIGGNVTLNGNGKGNDEIGVETYGSFVNIGGNLTLLGGIGNDRMGTEAYGAYGSGTHDLPIPGQLRVGGAFTVVGGTGANQIGTDNALINGPTTLVAGNVEYNLYDTTFNGGVLVEGLASNDYFDIEDNVFNNGITVIGGGSNDTLYFPGDNTVHGPKTFVNVKLGEII